MPVALTTGWRPGRRGGPLGGGVGAGGGGGGRVGGAARRRPASARGSLPGARRGVGGRAACRRRSRGGGVGGRPGSFRCVGSWYRDFSQTGDEKILAVLRGLPAPEGVADRCQFC